VDDLSHFLSEFLEVTSSVGINTGTDVLKDGFSVHFEVILDELEVLSWVDSDINGIIKLFVVER
jgi:hypothetical protein